MERFCIRQCGWQYDLSICNPCIHNIFVLSLYCMFLWHIAFCKDKNCAYMAIYFWLLSNFNSLRINHYTPREKVFPLAFKFKTWVNWKDHRDKCWHHLIKTIIMLHTLAHMDLCFVVKTFLNCMPLGIACAYMPCLLCV